MCWESHNPNKVAQKTAHSNIKVIKILAQVNGRAYFAPYMKIKYTIGEEISADKLDEPSIPSWGLTSVIRHGIHSYSVDCGMFINGSGLTVLDSWCGCDGFDICIMDGYIPEGSHYYENEHGEIVSDKIVVERRLNKLEELVEMVRRDRAESGTERGCNIDTTFKEYYQFNHFFWNTRIKYRYLQRN